MKYDAVTGNVNDKGEIVKVVRGVPVPCLYCDDGLVHMAVGNVDGDEAFHCKNCKKSWGVQDARNLVEGWSRLLEWLEGIPTYVPEED